MSAHSSGLPAAVLGTGQTHHVSRRTDVSMAGLCREAIDAAMTDADIALAVDIADDAFSEVAENHPDLGFTK